MLISASPVSLGWMLAVLLEASLLLATSAYTCSTVPDLSVQNNAICGVWRGFSSSVSYVDTLFPGTVNWGCDSSNSPLTPYCDPSGDLTQNWVGVTCGDFDPLTGAFDSSHPECNNIIRLELNGMGQLLQGTISPLIADLSYLQVVSITSAPISGSIPTNIGNLVHLNELNIFDTIGVATTTGLIGAIPGSIDQLCNLQYLRLNDNRLTSAIPSTMCHMQNIIELTFANNRLVRNVPPCFCALTKLTSLALEYNRLACYPDCVINAPLYGGVFPLARPSDVIPSACVSCNTTLTYGEISGTLLNSSFYYKSLDRVTRYCSGARMPVSPDADSRLL